MARARHFSSDRGFLPAVLATLVVLGGCMGDKTVLGDAPALRLHAQPDAQPLPAAAPAPAVPAARVPSGNVRVQPASAVPRASAWCDYLRADSRAQATVLRAPSLRGSMDDEGAASLAVGLSVTDFVKAGVLEQSAEVRCRKHLAENGLSKLIFLAPQDLTAAGYRAKARAVQAQHKEIARLRGKVKRALEDGLTDQATATALEVLADQIEADGSAARSQAERRMREAAAASGSAGALSAELLRAESDMEDINSRMRTLDAMDVSVSAGWNDNLSDTGLDAENSSFGGKVSFSLKLGALSPGRYRQEREAKDARLRAIREEGGLMWQAAVLHRAHERALSGLQAQDKNLAAAIAKAEALAATLASIDNPEFEPPLIEVKLQLIKLRADRAGVQGSIAEIRANMQKLDAG
jgi:hypothetical protein